jgi:hypothetical protein
MGALGYKKYNVDYDLAFSYVKDIRITKRELANKLGLTPGQLDNWLAKLRPVLRYPILNRCIKPRTAALYDEWDYDNIYKKVYDNKLIKKELADSMGKSTPLIDLWVSKKLTPEQQQQITALFKLNKKLVKRTYKPELAPLQKENTMLPFNGEAI